MISPSTQPILDIDGLLLSFFALLAPINPKIKPTGGNKTASMTLITPSLSVFALGVGRGSIGGRFSIGLFKFCVF